MSEPSAPYESTELKIPPESCILTAVDITRIARSALQFFRLTQGIPQAVDLLEAGILSEFEDENEESSVAYVKWIAMNEQANAEDLYFRAIQIGGGRKEKWVDLSDYARAYIVLFWSIARSMAAFIVWPE